MQKVFLSHSSADKESYVRIVAKKLINNIGEENVILDEITFQQARKTIEEIDKGLNETDLFVFRYPVRQQSLLCKNGHRSVRSRLL